MMVTAMTAFNPSAWEERQVEFKASRVYTESSRTAKALLDRETPSQKRKQQNLARNLKNLNY